MRVSKKYLIPITILLLVGVDQISKYFVQSKLEIGEMAFMLKGGFGITYVINDGSSLGFLLAWKVIRPLVVVAPKNGRRSFWAKKWMRRTHQGGQSDRICSQQFSVTSGMRFFREK